MNIARSLSTAILLFCALGMVAQGSVNRELVDIRLVPDATDWTYKVGQKPKVTVFVESSQTLLTNVEISYEAGLELMPATLKKSQLLKTGEGIIELPTLKAPGFQTLWVKSTVNGREYKRFITLGYEPEKIQPTVENPVDFDEYWKEQRRLSDLVELSPEVTLLQDRCTRTMNVYHVGFQVNKNGSRIYGILAMPKAPGKYPAVIRVPGAGIRPYNGDFAWVDHGCISFEVGIHSLPVNQSARMYESLRNGALVNYHSLNMDNRDRFYYNRVYSGCRKAIDYIYSLPEFDGSNLALVGGSQGGALAIVITALDERVTCYGSFYPALSDMTGYLHGRAGGWPHALKNESYQTPANLKTIGYYDVVNFARRLKVPGFISMGYNDRTCPPTSTYSVYNVITAPKEFMLVPETGHWTYPEQQEAMSNFILKQLGVK